MAAAKPIPSLIYHPERIGFLELVLLLFSRSNANLSFVDPEYEWLFKDESGDNTFLVILALILRKILAFISQPLKIFGGAIEYGLNLLSINGGILGLITNIIEGKTVLPVPESGDYRSIISLVDGREELYKDSLYSPLPSLEGNDAIFSERRLVDLCMKASKVAYENKNYIQRVVINVWNMHLVGAFDFWNAFQKEKNTQAFMFCDKAKDIEAIVVAFRGTEAFSAKDWDTDLDLSYIQLGSLGRAHVGFLKGLGLTDENDYVKGLPIDDERIDKALNPFAYYTIREKLRTLLKENPKAKFVVTGHSLGGALAVLMTTILLLHKEDEIMERCLGVFTFGQPRVGDEDLSEFMDKKLNEPTKRYYRVVYRYDLVPRVPFSELISNFQHSGECLYYRNWYNGKIMDKMPNANYFSLKYLVSHYFNAWLDFFWSFVLWHFEGEDYKEGIASTVFRAFGFLIPGIASHSPRDYVNYARLAKRKKWQLLDYFTPASSIEGTKLSEEVKSMVDYVF
ncbi:uncharacterized protein LOC18427461 [Amborella trichopoda]|uniref:uncharacterized protein LOC18427461 n=1 Tax=Amborella trichopoda TaxID=13333 RepID=UPI0009BD57C3|nr:uncharacterized protein LOC18427461 [Amborella trichopoda]|eukprot:XP_020518831.1 uncharacterized protein LOC18427461 [Amborella trichopoda]